MKAPVLTDDPVIHFQASGLIGSPTERAGAASRGHGGWATTRRSASGREWPWAVYRMLMPYFSIMDHQRFGYG